MKKIGIIGGMGPESTIMYYRDMIQLYHEHDALNTPEIVIYSINLEEMSRLQKAGDRAGQLSLLSGALNHLNNTGVDLVAMAANTPHIFYNELLQMSSIPIVSIVLETIEETLLYSSVKRAGLLGTTYTMEGSFYQEEGSRAGIEIFVPGTNDRKNVNHIIYNELVRGIVREASKRRLLRIIGRMIKKHGIDVLILGCTELPLIIDSSQLDIHVVNTVKVHVKGIVRQMIPRYTTICNHSSKLISQYPKIP